MIRSRFDGGVVAKAKDRKRFEAEAGDEFFVPGVLVATMTLFR